MIPVVVVDWGFLEWRSTDRKSEALMSARTTAAGISLAVGGPGA